MTGAYLNRIGTAVPDHDIHSAFVAFACSLLPDIKERSVFERMSARSGIAHRYSHFQPGDIEAGEVDADGFFERGHFPDTASRMALYATRALDLALRAVLALDIDKDRQRITHLIVASCTGFTAPGLDVQLCERLGLGASVSRTIVGFMGCSAAVPALRLAQQAVLADPSACVLVVNLELSSLHLQESGDVATLLSLMLFGDGCAASLVSAEQTGIALHAFRNAIIANSQDLITWKIGNQGFLMHLSGEVPGRIAGMLREERARSDPQGLLHGEGTQAIDLWAVHGGGRTVLDAVEIGLGLPAEALRFSRGVLRDFGNMSSATVMFVLARMLAEGGRHCGFAMAFGPGMVAETFRFSLV
jgi:predicted naringenin-chalcone synthase